MSISLSFVPANVVGVADVASVTIYPDRLCLTMESGEEVEHSFERMARIHRSKTEPWWKRILPFRRHCFVGERDFCSEDRYFRWFTNPEIILFTPPDPPEASYDETWFYKIHQVMWEGQYRTWDLA